MLNDSFGSRIRSLPPLVPSIIDARPEPGEFSLILMVEKSRELRIQVLELDPSLPSFPGGLRKDVGGGISGLCGQS